MHAQGIEQLRKILLFDKDQALPCQQSTINQHFLRFLFFLLSPSLNIHFHFFNIFCNHLTESNLFLFSIQLLVSSKSKKRNTSNKMAQPLSDRSTNTHLANNGADAISHEKIEDLKSAPANLNSLDYHRQVLQGKIEEGDKYVFSPFLVYTRRETNITVQEPSQLRLALG